VIASPSSRTSTRPERAAAGGRRGTCRSPLRSALAAIAAAVLTVFAGCAREGQGEPDADPQSFEPWPPRHLQQQTLELFEAGLRARADRWRAELTRTDGHAMPRAIARLPGSRQLVGLVGGHEEVVLLSPDGAALARAPSPAAPTALDVTREGTILVAGAPPGSLARYRRIFREEDGEVALRRLEDLEVPDASRIVAIASAGPISGHGWIFVADAAGHVQAIHAEAAAVSLQLGACAPPQRLAASARHLVAACGDLELRVWQLAETGAPERNEPAARIAHGGPVWALHAAERWDADARRRRGLLIATAGPGSADGARWSRDAAVSVYGFSRKGLEEIGAAQVAAHGVLTPTFTSVAQGEDGSVRVDVIGFSGDRRAALTWPGGDFARGPAIDTYPALPGTLDAAPLAPGFAKANALLGGWSIDRPEPTFAAADRTELEAPMWQLGQALAFTTLIADPTGPTRNAGCGLCHHERPALERTPREAALKAFVEVNASDAQTPFFSLDTREVPWLALLPGLPERLSPVTLRYALMSYLDAFELTSHPLHGLSALR
jgi:hypothetical protein